jgi:hypothetical protein
MSLFALLAVYLTAAVSLVGGVVAALVSLAGPVEPSTPPPATIASVDPVRGIIVEPRQQAFRYGPEINHGRSDTPVYARQQALREARAMAPPVRIRHHRSDRGQAGLTREPGPAAGYTPSVPSSGH